MFMKKVLNSNWVGAVLTILLRLAIRTRILSDEMLKKWLVLTEERYGGFIKGVKRRKISPRDPRPHEALYRVGEQGGDRMAFHGYARKYAEYLTSILLNYILNDRQITIVEIGILKGTGLAIWDGLFPKGRLIGLDIDLSYIVENMGFLKGRGAFKGKKPELYEFDQYLDNSHYMGRILNGDGIDICVDDGVHTAETILLTLKSMMPYLSKQFVYFVEDNPDVHEQIRKRYPRLNVENAGELTIITRF